MWCSVFGLNRNLFGVRVHVFSDEDKPAPKRSTPNLRNPEIGLQAGPQLLVKLKHVDGVIDAFYDHTTLYIDIRSRVGWDTIAPKVIKTMEQVALPASRVFTDFRSGEPYFEFGGGNSVLTALEFRYGSDAHP